MIRALAWQHRILLTVALGAGLVAALWAFGETRYRQGWAEGRAAMELDQRRAAEDTRRRIRDADTGTGDHDDDLRWLIERLRPTASR